MNGIYDFCKEKHSFSTNIIDVKQLNNVLEVIRRFIFSSRRTCFNNTAKCLILENLDNRVKKRRYLGIVCREWKQYTREWLSDTRECWGQYDWKVFWILNERERSTFLNYFFSDSRFLAFSHQRGYILFQSDGERLTIPSLII